MRNAGNVTQKFDYLLDGFFCLYKCRVTIRIVAELISEVAVHSGCPNGKQALHQQSLWKLSETECNYIGRQCVQVAWIALARDGMKRVEYFSTFKRLPIGIHAVKNVAQGVLVVA